MVHTRRRLLLLTLRDEDVPEHWRLIGMTETYPKAPLVELIAEVQWFVPGPVGVPLPMPFDPQLYEQFAAAVENLGFTHSERLMPEGFPTLAGQVVARFRERRDQPPIYQIGPGIFSANGLPPTYSNWEGFAPFLYKGLEAVSAARGQATDPYASIKLRYIDAFGPVFLQGKSTTEFIEQDLGFAVSLPAAVSAVTTSETNPLVTIQAVNKIAHGGELQVSVGHGVLNDVPQVLMDVSVTYPGVDQGDTSKRFDEAHTIAPSLFVGSTQTLAPTMRGSTS